MKEMGIGVLGFGAVGASVVEVLCRNSELIAKRINVRLVVRAVADVEIEGDSKVAIDSSILKMDAEKIIADPSVQIIVETIGGTRDAKELVMKALKAGKPVVTASKALLAKHGAELFKTATDNNVELMYEASVAGGIPVLAALRKGLVANDIKGVYGILSGTCNYILTQMEREEVSFAEALAAAQELGFAEADPSLDIDGVGTAHKAAIIGALAYGYPIDINDIYTHGISEVQPLDIVCANELGYRIKLLATIEYRDGQSEISVSPTLVPHGHPLAEIDGEYNAVMIDGDIVGETMYYGRGAGCLSIASAVLADIAELAAGLATNSPMRLPSFVNHDYYGQLRIMGNVTARYYMRVTLMNAPGVLSKVSAVMGENGIGIESAIQRGLAVGEMVPVIFLTQKARVWNCLSAMMAIDMLEVVGGKTVCYRIANF